MLTVFASPSRYVQGRNATALLGAQIQHLQLPGPALIVATERTRALLEPAWRESLEAVGMPFAVHVFGGECSMAAIEAGVAAARVLGAGVVIGAGGGKALDTSRGIAAAVGARVVNCPTIASSDAPCSALSVVYTEDGIFDQLIFYPRNPDLVLVDTTLVAQASRRFLVSGMGDALATWYEARSVIDAHSVNQLGGGTSITARGLAELCCRTLFADGLAAARSVDARAVTPALERVVEANTLLSGLGFESGGLAIAHSVHNGLTAAPPTHAHLHGEKVAFGLLVQLVVEGRPSSEIDEVIAFCRSVGLPTTLAEVSLADADDEIVATVATRTVAPGETAHHEPFEVTAAMIADGIRVADELGRAWQAE